jgi:hypothetical protein
MGDNNSDRGGPGDDPPADEEVAGEAASRRRSREDLKELVLSAGVEVLERDGLGLSIGSLTYAKVFAFIQETYGITVSRASVHERIWDSRDEFRNAVLARAMAYSSSPVLDPVTLSMNEVIETLELETQDGRERALRNLLRLGIDLSQEFSVSSNAARRQIAVKAMCLTEGQPDLVDRVREVLRRDHQQRRADFLARFRGATEAFHLKVNPTLGLSIDEALNLIERQVGRLAAATVLDHGLVPDDPETVSVTWPDGSTEAWSPLALGVYAIISFVFVEDDTGRDTGGGGAA